MGIKVRNQIAAIARILVSAPDPSSLKESLRVLFEQAPSPELFLFASKWLSEKTAEILSSQAIWAELKQIIADHPQHGFALIEGKNIHDIPSFYAEINRVYMSDENWAIGSLDGFNDLLYGGFGKLSDADKHTMIWKDIAYSREKLGVAVTLQYYRNKLSTGSPYNQTYFQQKLTDLQAGKGQTYFDIITEIILSHNKVDWIY